MTNVTLLRGVSFFGGLTDEELETVDASSSVRDLARGDVLFREGDDPEELFVVQDGRIAMTRESIDGRESVLALMEVGDLFGEMGMFGGVGRSTDARALERSMVVVVPYASVRAIWDNRPQLLWSVVTMLADRLRRTDDALADSMFLDVAGRTAKRLLDLSGGADEFALPVTQEELAGMVGASRERVNKALASFVKLGWLGQSDRRYRILDRTALERRAS